MKPPMLKLIKDPNDLETKQRTVERPRENNRYESYRKATSTFGAPATLASKEAVYYWRLPPVGIYVAKGYVYCHNCLQHKLERQFEVPDFVFCKSCRALGFNADEKDQTERLAL